MGLLPTWPLGRWLLVSHGVVLFLPVLAVLATGALRADLERQTRDDLDHQAALLALHVAHVLERAPEPTPWEVLEPELSVHLRRARERTLAGFRVVDRHGLVVASSGEGLGDDLGEDPTVRLALGGSVAEARKPREVRTRGAMLDPERRRAAVRVVLASPVEVDHRTVGAVILNRTPREEVQALFQMAPRLWAGASLALLGTVALAWLAGWRLSRTLSRVAGVARRVAAGDLVAAGSLVDAGGSHVAESADLARALAAMTDRLRARLRYASELAGNVSHELKTPLSSLRGTIELLRDDEEMPAAQRERFLGHALLDLDRSNRLLGGLLRLARAEEGVPHTTVPLGDFVRSVLRAWPTVPLEGTAGSVRLHNEQAESALRNLVENAFQHGGDGVSVRVRCGEDAGAPWVEVEDDGPGISSGNLPRIWDRFFTTGRERGGTGLGLSLVRAVAEAHGGTVRVESEPGRTVFRWTFPAAQSPLSKMSVDPPT